MTSKERLINLLVLLYKRTDIDHQMSTREIVEYFKAQGVPTDRETIKADIDTLNACGIEIYTARGTQTKYFFAERLFELAELKLMIEAVESSKFITTKKSEALVSKLMTFAGEPSEGA